VRFLKEYFQEPISTKQLTAVEAFITIDNIKDLFPEPATAENLYNNFNKCRYICSGHLTKGYIGTFIKF